MSQQDYSKHLEKMVNEITTLSTKTASKIKAEAEKKSKEIIAQGEAEASKLESEISLMAESEARQNVRRDVSKKKLSIQMDYLNLRESIIESILVNVTKELQKLSKQKSYEKLIEKMLEESVLAINGGELYLSVRSEDKGLFTEDKLNKLASSISEKTSITLSDQDLKTIGGLVLSRKDGLITVNNTFEKIIERRMDEIRQVIVSELLN